jgi:cell surface protein SprA|tara:strand:- start:23985 stop:31310 length:7326 start_codon:yes stop_codon:yes gene_type:complete
VILNNLLKYNTLRFLLLCIAIILQGNSVFAQDDSTMHFPIVNVNDPTLTQPQSFDLGDPSSVQQTIIYDPITGKYVFQEQLGKSGVNFRNPSMMTLDEYLEYERKKALADNWKEKIDEQTEEGQPLEYPIKINSKVFENFFGSDEITIRPQGSVELSFGVNSSRYDNPILPVKQRRVTRFDFQQQIQLNLVGQIGTKLKIGASYNTQAAFDFDNITKLEYTGKEDQIMQKIALGNVSMPLPTSLIQGSQTLFGAYTQMKFGRATVDLIAASSKGKRQEINIEGKAQIQPFALSADNYEVNRHYFLNMYHHDHYDEAMATAPIVSSTINITRIEVWLTNRTNNIENTRNIVAFSDIGEGKQVNLEGNPGNVTGNDIPDNSANGLYDWASNQPLIRGFNNAVSVLAAQTNSPGPFKQAVHYEKVENAKKLTEQEYSYNAQLGYISLNIPLNNDEVLGVAYEYTYRGQTYQVGELSTDGIDGQNALIVKLLKPTITSPQNKIWDLMMKNVYSIGAYQVDQTGFRLNILYNNPETSLLVPFFPYPGLDEVQLITMLEMDRINLNQQPFQDGVFDFVPITFNGNRQENGGTINTRNGRVYFSTVEPFGKTLKKKLQDANMPGVFIDRIAFTELYDSTKTAAQQIPSKNRFMIQGEFQSSVTSDIPLNALNVPEGAVSVTAGGIKLTEGVDYTVDYNLGRVKILNSGILESNTPIKVSIESNSVFGFQARSLIGGRYNYRFNENFNVGGTWMRMLERPVTQKVDIGSEPFKNNIIGVDVAFKTEVPFLTKLVDFLPVISTREKSYFSFTGEFAHLIPGTPRAINKTGISYVDDFEGSQSTIDLKSFSAWHIASVPQGQPDLFPEADLTTLKPGFNRAKLAWYSIDPVFFQNNQFTPQHIQDDQVMKDDSRMRLVQQTDIFPNLQQQYGSVTNISVLDLAYYPKERGMYNYDTTNTVDADGLFTNPQARWGGITRALTTNDFEQANIEFIQFWMLDPFNADAENADPTTSHSGGDLYFNLGNVSEDVLKDSRKSFENGLPPTGSSLNDNLDTTNWAKVSTQQVVVNAFDQNSDSRANQDVGLDGWKSSEEQIAFANYVAWVQSNSTLSAAAKARMVADASSDDYTYYLDDRYDSNLKNILERYKKFNGTEGNSPTTEMSAQINQNAYTTMSTVTPDNEDINQDNNLGEAEAYFQYKVSLRKNDLVEGKNFVTNIQEYQNGTKTERWIQFKVPVQEFQKRVNGINDFRSIRFMRMFMKDFDEEVVLRFARLEFVRGEWRKYLLDLTEPGETQQSDPNLTLFNIAAVNIEENNERVPVAYVIPPGITREIDPSQQNQRQLNEQSLSLEVCNLKDGDARGAYRNVQFDVRTYKKLKMFVHAEQASNAQPLKDDDLTLFIRLGTDFVDNYYEYEIPLKKTAPGATVDTEVWPELNNVEIIFDNLLDLKKERNRAIETGNATISYTVEYAAIDPENSQRRIKVKGSPNLQGIRTMMIGIRNPDRDQNITWQDDGQSKCATVWVNELRLTDFISEGGSAAVAQAQVQLADFANVAMSGNYSGTNWGSVESRVQERQRNQKFGVDINTNIQLGQFFGKRARVSLPFFYGYSRGVINPEYDPFNPDVRLKDYDLTERKEKARLGQDFTERKSYNFTNVRKELKAGAKPTIFSISNWSAGYSYSELLQRDFNITYDRTKTWSGNLNYAYSFNSKPIEPFKKVKFMSKSKYWRIVREMNLFLLPKNISFSNDATRMYNERQIRNNLVPDFEFAPVYAKQFFWNRRYGLGYDITKNLKATFDATNKALFSEANGRVDRKEDPEGYQQFKDSIRTQMRTFGKTTDYSHNYNLTYNIPFDKIPVLDMVSGNIKYGGSYNWQRAPLGQNQFGNVMQNNRTVNVTGQVNMTNLYNKIPYLKRVNGAGRGNTRGRIEQSGDSRGNTRATPPPKPSTIEKDTVGMSKREKRKYFRKIRRDERKARQEKNKNKEVNPIAGFGLRMVMSLRNVSATYGQNDGTLLPGYRNTANVLGFDDGYNNTLGGFIFGRQSYSIFGKENGYDIANASAERGWLVKNQDLNKQHTIAHSTNFSGRASLEPFKDFTIELTMNRTYNINSNDFFRWDETSQQYEAQSRVEVSTLTYTNITIGSAFTKYDRKTYSSATFDQMLTNLSQVSEIVGSRNANSSLLSTGYYDGYGKSQQEVVLGAFLTAYGNKSASSKTINPLSNVPLPNWTVNYNGLSKFKFMKKFVRNFVLRHGYSSTTSVSGIQTNLNATFDQNDLPTARDLNNNYIAQNQIQNVTMTERFSPLFGLDATWIVKSKGKEQGLLTKFEIKKDRSVTLSLNNNQVTEIVGNEIVVGSGYKFTQVKLPIKQVKASDVNLRFDFSFRDNLTVIRKIVENTDQATAGQRVVSIKFSADYNVGKNLTIMYYYDQVINTPKIASSYPTGNLSTGIRLRFNLGGIQ